MSLFITCVLFGDFKILKRKESDPSEDTFPNGENLSKWLRRKTRLWNVPGLL